MNMKAPNPLPEGIKPAPPPPPRDPRGTVVYDRHYILRRKDYDGMGGWEYEYFCSNCNLEVTTDFNFCPRCGVKLEGIKDEGPNGKCR